MDFHWIILQIPVVLYGLYIVLSFGVTSLVLGQSYDCPSASEVTLKDWGKLSGNEPQQNTTKRKLYTYYYDVVNMRAHYNSIIQWCVIYPLCKPG